MGFFTYIKRKYNYIGNYIFWCGKIPAWQDLYVRTGFCRGITIRIVDKGTNG
jgi:hypothetical protein